MGLDMYLDRKVYNHIIYEKDDENYLKRPSVVMDGISYDRVREITMEFGYWRKANAIHKWFVDNVQGGDDDCHTYYVPVDKLVALRKLCSKVIKNPEKAPKLLPVCDGCFFGSTEYDEHYFDQLKYTVALLKGIEKSTDEFEYWSSW